MSHFGAQAISKIGPKIEMVILKRCTKNLESIDIVIYSDRTRKERYL